ncbi:uncharacterized protein LOC130939788 [Arachis stenosperma]|uniref:uncharacterized protein LOC130939788 n=1 Tax=Arachis stenosperma TaxID=217475 RepID=UPI0025AD6961|nr:uncharacterized protein LOC130939788 [Arachis stenosperma]
MAPRGCGRGHGRGRTSTQGPEPNPNDSVNFIAALKNMAAAMQATGEALGHQINNNGNGGNGAQDLMTLATFLKVNPPKFKGATNLTEADTWFQAMERALQAQLVLKNQCVEFVTYLLTREASHWWQGTRRLLQLGDDPITWDSFQVQFYKKYYPNFARMAKEIELLQLKQGAPGDFEEWRCIKYEGGLRSNIFSLPGPMEIRTFSELVIRAGLLKSV